MGFTLSAATIDSTRPPPDTPPTWADGTSATFISDADIVDLYISDGSGGETDQYVSGYLMLSDGTRYRIDGGYVTWLRDRNGNYL